MMRRPYSSERHGSVGVTRGTFKLPRYSTIPTHRACVDLLWGCPPAAINSPCAVRFDLYAQIHVHSLFFLPCTFYSTWRRRYFRAGSLRRNEFEVAGFLEVASPPLSGVPTLMAITLVDPPPICASAKQIIPVIGWPLILCATSGGT